MSEHTHHEDLMKGIYNDLKEILDNSDQSIYVYLDDIHKLCNKRFANMLGYDSPSDWAKVKTPFTDTFVDKLSRGKLVDAYRKAMEKLDASNVNITWKKKDGKKVKTEVILLPYMFKGHMFAVHYIA